MRSPAASLPSERTIGTPEWDDEDALHACEDSTASQPRDHRRITVSTEQTSADGRPASAPPELTRAQIEKLEDIYGNRYLLEPAPDGKLPKMGMTADEAMGLVQ